MALWRRFGGGRSAASTFSPQRTPRGKHGKANTITQKRTYTAPPTPFPVPLVLCRDRRQKTRKPEVNPQSRIIVRTFENARMAITTHGGIGTQHIASRFSFPDEGKETGVIERKTFQQERMAGVRGAQNATCRETPPLSGEATHIAATGTPRPADQPPARTIPSAGAATGQTQPFAGAQFPIL